MRSIVSASLARWFRVLPVLPVLALAPAVAGCSSTEAASEPSAFPRAEDASGPRPSADKLEAAATHVVRADDERDPIGPQDQTALARGAYLVWGRPPATPPGAPDTTYAIAADGKVVTEVPATIVAANGRLYRWQIRRVDLARRACRERLDGVEGVEPEQVRAAYEAWQEERADLASHPTRTVDQAELVELRSGSRKVISQLHPEDAGSGDLTSGANDFRFDVTLVGSAGPLLFVRESTWVDACGAHGNAFSAAGILDLANDAKVTDLGAIAPRALRRARARAEKQFDVLRKEWSGEAEDDAELVELLPQYDARGSLSFLGRFATFAPYAFSSGDWASYTMATTTPLGALPERLARASAAPPAVRALLRAKPGFVMGGYSATS
ncbi:hypothetical protein [Pendulispora albinea]|uniref:DUF3298 domain-containing protein n=1 Tax=Pendulispora albinea TaxID=2741071 RepID=A0ABZ2LRP2_9BACT